MLLETFWRLSLTASHVQTQIFFWKPQSWHRVYKPSAWGLGAFNLQHAALMLLFTVIHREPKGSCLIIVECTVSVTQSIDAKYTINIFILSPPFWRSLWQRIRQGFQYFPLSFWNHIINAKILLQCQRFVFSGDGLSTNAQRNSYSCFITEARAPLRTFNGVWPTYIPATKIFIKFWKDFLISLF